MFPFSCEELENGATGDIPVFMCVASSFDLGRLSNTVQEVMCTSGCHVIDKDLVEGLHDGNLDKIVEVCIDEGVCMG